MHHGQEELTHITGSVLVPGLPCAACNWYDPCTPTLCDSKLQGAFSHSARTAPIITVIIQVTTLKTTHLRNHAQSIQNSKIKHLMLAMGPRDLNDAPYSPVHCSSHSMTSFQSSDLTELPVVENSQRFAQRAHSARYAPSER